MNTHESIGALRSVLFERRELRRLKHQFLAVAAVVAVLVLAFALL